MTKKQPKGNPYTRARNTKEYKKVEKQMKEAEDAMADFIANEGTQIIHDAEVRKELKKHKAHQRAVAKEALQLKNDAKNRKKKAVKAKK